MKSKFSRWILHKLILSTILLVTFSVCDQPDSSNRSMPIHSSPTCRAANIFCRNCSSDVPFKNIVVQLIAECHPNYTNAEIIQKCQNFSDADFIKDQSLFTPITYTKKNITYWNVYCGICNFENESDEFERWRPWLFCRLQPNPTLGANSSAVLPRFVNSISNSEVFNGLKVDERRHKVISVFNDSTYNCNNIFRDLPEYLRMHVPICVDDPSEADVAAPAVDIFRENIFSHFHPRNNAQFCSAATASEMESFCDYRNEYGEICSVNLFLNRTNDSICNADGFIVSNLLKDDNNGTRNQCSNHKKDTIYVCGPTEAPIFKKIKRIVLKILDYVSTFLLFLYLVITSNKQNLRSLPKRIFYSYSLSLWALYLCEFILKHIESCVIKYYVFFYIWQSHSFWILITAYDLWRIVYDSLKLQLVSVEGQKTRFLIYCFVGWGLPGIFLAALYPTLEDNQKSWSCPSVCGFEKELTCFSRCELNKHTFYFGWITIVIFLIIAPCLLVLTVLFVGLSWRNRVRSNVNKTYTVTLLKVAVMMGVHWMLLAYLSLFDSGEKFSAVYEFISSFHGSFIFVAFGLEKNTLSGFKRLLLRNRINEQTQCTSMTQTSQEIKSSTQLDESSVDARKGN